MKSRIRTALVFIVGAFAALGGNYLANRLMHPPAVQAQSVFKIDPALGGVNSSGQLVAYHLTGTVTVPAGSTNIYTGNSLSAMVQAIADDAYNSKGGSPTGRLLTKPETLASLTPHPPCPPTGPGGCAKSR